ncbi:MAG: acylneuraminate cytidylyltransferase family protein [Candidatus Melainabacteria bacterium]|nr:MAG: acylneuraminate cytidylyltransferase family protein [Candidatus Melainabacteria bacterium]
MEILSIIPARGGSKGIKRKNIKLLGGIPLVAHTINASLRSKYITRTCVSTEDPEIKDICLNYKAEVIDRPLELAKDETKTAPVMLDVLKQLKDKENYTPDVVVLLQATCPLRTEKHIDEAFELFFDDKNCDSVFAAVEDGVTHATWRMTPDEAHKMECLYDYRNRPRRQDTHLHYKRFVETGSIYIVKTDIMLKVKDFIGENPKVYKDPTFWILTPKLIFEKAQKYFI